MRRHRILLLAILAGVACRQRPGEPAAEVKPTTPAAAQAEDDPRVKCPEHATQKQGQSFGTQTIWCEDPDGLSHGPKRMWDLSTGRMIDDREYVHGKITGTQRAWYPDGRPNLESTCYDGMQDGPSRAWYANGQLALEVFHDKGRRVDSGAGGTRTVACGRRRTTGRASRDRSTTAPRAWIECAGLQNMMNRHWLLLVILATACRQQPAAPAAEVKPATPVAAQVENDPRVVCPAGAVQKQHESWGIKTIWCEDSDELNHGPEKAWDVGSGQQVDEKEYVHGQLTGTRRGWYPTGQIQLEATCTDAMEDGRTRYWYPNGQLTYEEFHSRGRRIGTWRWWDENGRLKKKENHRDGSREPLDPCIPSSGE